MSSRPREDSLPDDDDASPENGRRRRKTVHSAVGDPAPPEERKSVIAFTGMWLIALFAMFAPGAPYEILHGVVLTAFGLLLLCCPPMVRVPRVAVITGLGLLLCCSAAFLPAKWFGIPAWRTALEALGQPTGSMVTAQPRLTGELLAGLAVSVIAGWFLLGHRVGDRAHLRLALCFSLGVAAYTGVSMIAETQSPRWAWDPVDTFGLFGNRNHTATVMVMGALCGLSVILQAIRSKSVAMAGWAALSVGICVWGLLGYSTSRAGLLLLGLGGLAWLCGLGRQYISLRLLLSALTVSGVAAGLFFSVENGLRSRLTQEWTKAEAAIAAKGANLSEESTDFRILLYRDTLSMIAREPLTGVGLGQFSYIFPQYREKSATATHCMVPESNWLLLASEAGPAAALLLAGGGAVLFLGAFRKGRQRRGWGLTLGTLLAAAAVPIHGIFDVPAHHTAIAWSALLLLALTLRRPNNPKESPPLIILGLFRMAGVVIMVTGIWLLHAEWNGDVLVGWQETRVTSSRVKSYYAEENGRKNNPSSVKSEENSEPLRLALDLVNQTLSTMPLDSYLHFLKGCIATNFPETRPSAVQAFAIHRLLEPKWVQAPLQQADQWSGIDDQQVLPLLKEALSRAEIMKSINPQADMLPKHVWEVITSMEKANPLLVPHLEGLRSAPVVP